MTASSIKLLVYCLSVLMTVSCASSQTGAQKGNGNSFSGGKWIIHEIDDTELVPVKQGDVPPFIDFMMEEKRLSAFAGCNRMSTGFSLSNDTLTVSQLVATKMACPDMTYEYAFEQALAPGNYTFRESGEKLIIFNNNKKVLLLKRPPASK